MASNPAMWILLIGTAIYGTVKLVDLLTVSLEEAKEKAEKATENFKNISDELKTVNDELDKNRDLIDDLLAKDKLTYLEKDELERLQQATKELERQKMILDSDLERAATDLYNANKLAFDKEFKDNSFSLTDVYALDNEYTDLNISPTSDLALIEQGVEGIAAAIVKVRKEKELAESSGNDEYLQGLEETEKEYQVLLSSQMNTLQEYRDNITNILNYRELTNEEQLFYDNLEQGLKLIASFTDPNTWNNIEINDIFNKEDIEVTKDELIALAKAGELDESTIFGYEKLNSAISESQLILSDGEDTISSFINEIYALAEQIEETADTVNESDISFAQLLELNDIKDIRNELISLSQAGKLDKDSIREYERFDEILQAIGKDSSITDEEVEAMIETINSLATKNPVDYLNDYGEQLSKLEDAYESFAKGERISSSQLSALQDVFGDLEAYKQLEKEILSGNTDLQESFDALATEIAQKNVPVLDELTEENKAYYESELQAMGISNAHEVIEDALASSQKYRQDVLTDLSTANNVLDASNRNLIISSEELDKATWQEITALLEEAGQSGITAEALTYYAMQKAIAEGIDLNNSNDISYLLNLAKAAGIATESITNLANAKAKLTELQTDIDNLNKRISVSGSEGEKRVLTERLETQNRKLNKEKENIEKLQESINDEILSFKPEQYSVDLNNVKFDGGDKVKDNLQKELDKASSGSEDTFEELVDFFERRIEVLNNSISLLDKNIENVVGSFAKNNLLNGKRDIYSEMLNNYSSALNMYKQKADEALSKLPADLAQKAKDGAINLTTFLGESNEAVVEAIKDYQSWASKVQDCSEQLAELKTTLRQLELQKFNNIVEDFTKQFDIRQSAGIDLISKQIDLFSEAGELIGESFYTTQKKQAEQQLQILKEEKKALTSQFNNALANGVDKASSEFLDMVDALTNVDSSILDCQKSIESFDNSILSLHTEVFNRIQKQFSSFDDELSNILGIIDDIDVATKDNIWTEAGLTKLGLISQQIELAERQVDQYNDEIAELNKQYIQGRLSATEYADKLMELQSELWDSANAAESARDAMLETNRARVDIVVKGIEDEIKAFKELIDERQKVLDQEKDLHDHQKSLEEKTKAITKLEREIATMTSTDAATTAKRMQKEAELAKAREELEEYEFDHNIQVAKDALNQQYEDYEKERNEEIDVLNESLNDQEKLIRDSLNSVKKNTSTIANQIDQIVTKHGVYISDTLTSSWKQGENAIAGYGQVLSIQSSAFIANLQTVENKEIELQNQANATSTSIAKVFSNKADNLVNELNKSYNAESNLNIITQTLHNSLVNTLSGSYSTNGIVGSINNITSAANSAVDAMNRLASAQGKSTASTTANSTTGAVASVLPITTSKKYYVVDDNTGKKVSSGYKYGDEAVNKLRELMLASGNKGRYSIKQYAKGVHKLKSDEWAWTQEQGSELVLSPSRNAMFTKLNADDTVLTNEQSENLYKLSKIDPKDLVPMTINNMLDNLKVKSNIPTAGNVVNAPSLNLDEFIHIDKVDGTNIKQVENIAKKAVDQLTKKLYDGMKYGSY